MEHLQNMGSSASLGLFLIGVHCDELARIHLNVCLGDWGLVAERKVCKIRSEQADRKEVENCFFFFL